MKQLALICGCHLATQLNDVTALKHAFRFAQRSFKGEHGKQLEVWIIRQTDCYLHRSLHVHISFMVRKLIIALSCCLTRTRMKSSFRCHLQLISFSIFISCRLGGSVRRQQKTAAEAWRQTTTDENMGSGEVIARLVKKVRAPKQTIREFVSEFMGMYILIVSECFFLFFF